MLPWVLEALIANTAGADFISRDWVLRHSQHGTERILRESGLSGSQSTLGEKRSCGLMVAEDGRRSGSNRGIERCAYEPQLKAGKQATLLSPLPLYNWVMVRGCCPLQCSVFSLQLVQLVLSRNAVTHRCIY